MRARAIAAAMLLTVPLRLSAEPLGTGTIFDNDFPGDGADRWRSGSFAVSHVRGTGWDGALPARVGDILEYRFRAEIIAPDNLSAPAPGDRPYAGIASFGLVSHFARAGTQMSVGANLVFTGPQTGISTLHDTAHELLAATGPEAATTAELENNIYPTVMAEAVHPLALSGTVEARPFVAAQAGAETMVRAGADVIFGTGLEGGLLLRDEVTGHLYPGIDGGGSGIAFLLGGDVAAVADSRFLPAGRGLEEESARTRLRAGLSWRSRSVGLFYGLTWLSEEFEAQPEGQVIGSLNLMLNF